MQNRTLPREGILGGHETAHRIGPAKFSVDSEQELVVVRIGKTVTPGVIELYAAQLRRIRGSGPAFLKLRTLRVWKSLSCRRTNSSCWLTRSISSRTMPSARWWCETPSKLMQPACKVAVVIAEILV